MNETEQALKNWTRWLAGWLVIGFALAFALSFLPINRDSTDPAWPGRSGLRPLTDAKTGCQYLATADGALTPRLKANGEQMGCK